MTTALIADDEPHLASHLCSQLALLWPELQVLAVARNGIEAAQMISAQAPDIAFLDIRMPGLNGLEVAQGIEGTTRVVFVTAFDEFAVQAFEQAALDYVLKPVTAERLTRTVARLRKALSAVPDGVEAATAPCTDDARLAQALQRLLGPGGNVTTASARLRHVRASQGDLTHQIDVADVLFFRADDKYTSVQTGAGEYLIRTPIVELLAQLDPDAFCQVHRSTLVNLKHVAGTRRDELSRLFVRLHGHAGELPVSRAYVHLFKAM
jgi:DNA-binding LytR/AlgR family response regulator